MSPRPKYTTPDQATFLVLWGGDVVRRSMRGGDVQAIRRFNDRVRTDARVESVMLPVADGLTLARKLP
jgi:caffeoyl-CoA O-methyltransferase